MHTVKLTIHSQLWNFGHFNTNLFCTPSQSVLTLSIPIFTLIVCVHVYSQLATTQTFKGSCVEFQLWGVENKWPEIGGVMIHIQFNFDYCLNFHYFNSIMPNINKGGFTISWSFVPMFENMTMRVPYMVCLTQGVVEGQGLHFYQAAQNGAENCKRLCLSIKNTHFKEFWILILQYNNSERVPWEKNAKKWNRNWNVESKNCELNWMVIITIYWELD